MSTLSRKYTYIHTCAIQYATHVNNSRPSQLRQSHCMRTSENTEEIIIDPCKWNKQQQASFPTCCAHVCGVSHIFFCPTKHSQCCRSPFQCKQEGRVDSRNNSSSPQPYIVFKRANLQTHCHCHCILSSITYPLANSWSGGRWLRA